MDCVLLRLERLVHLHIAVYANSTHLSDCQLSDLAVGKVSRRTTSFEYPGDMDIHCASQILMVCLYLASIVLLETQEAIANSPPGLEIPQLSVPSMRSLSRIRDVLLNHRRCVYQ